jgi:hypothetical protein
MTYQESGGHSNAESILPGYILYILIWKVTSSQIPQSYKTFVWWLNCLPTHSVTLPTTCILHDQMLPLHSQLSRLGLQQYYEVLAGHGFESWHDLMDITEEDLIAFNFKLGHRRKFNGQSLASEVNLTASHWLAPTLTCKKAVL